MPKGAIYKKQDEWRIRFTTAAGDRVDRRAHTSNEREARQLLATLTALAGLCYLYAVPFDPDDTLADIAHELGQARNEVERVFGQIRCPHCSRRIVPEFRPAEALRHGQALERPAPKRKESALPVLDTKLADRIVHDIVKSVTAKLEGRIVETVEAALGPRKLRCSVPRCKEPAFSKGLCHRHYYRDYHAKRIKRERAEDGC